MSSTSLEQPYPETVWDIPASDIESTSTLMSTHGYENSFEENSIFVNTAYQLETGQRDGSLPGAYSRSQSQEYDDHERER